MKKEEFDIYYKRIVKLENKIKQLQIELDEVKGIISPFIQFHRPQIVIASFKEKYWHSNTPIQFDGKLLVRHSVYLGNKENFDGKSDKKLIKFAENKMGELLRRKYPQMFE
jgi:hypothetical protein